jgi:hypothetical protein
MEPFSIFITKSPSFLLHSEDLKRRKGSSNAESLFGMKKNPSYNQIRSMLVSFVLQFSDFWDPIRFTVPYLLMAVIPALTWLVEKRYSGSVSS